MVPVIGALPLFVAMNAGTFPVPEATNPMAGLEFVQLKFTPAGVPERLLAGISVPSVTVVSDSKSTVGTGVTVTATVKDDCAHCPAFAVKIYVPEVWLLIVAGVHTPVIPFAEVVGRTGAVLPEQMLNAFPNANVGLIF